MVYAGDFNSGQLKIRLKNMYIFFVIVSILSIALRPLPHTAYDPKTGEENPRLAKFTPARSI